MHLHVGKNRANRFLYSKLSSDTSQNKTRSRSRTPKSYSQSDRRNLITLYGSTPTEEPQLAPWVRESTLTFKDPLLLLHEEIIDFYDFMQPNPLEKANQEDILNRLTAMVKSIWPDAEIQVFGSFANGLWLPTSDIDVSVRTNTNLSTRASIDLLAASLIKTKMASELEKIYTARVPLLKFLDRSTSLSIDVSFSIGQGMEWINLVKDYLVKYPEAKYIIFVLKYYLKQRELNETFNGGIGSYLLFCMVISSIQMHPAHKDGGKHYGGYTLGHFLVHFFQLYGHEFNYSDIGIDIKWNGSYFQKRNKEWCKGKGEFLCVECPQGTNNDIGRGAFRIKLIREAFKHALSMICSQTYVSAKTPLNLILISDDFIKNRKPYHISQCLADNT
ncbi:unnamed protein product [Blepharisma stoltei]|uniref:Polynucleotide adenylyltransferase n=1 Tax=Blepharisma stoltei TaxID=1481888 RepID=A0AAU9JHF8_9CILI|nr:unnamed protein product [Blepharisma stoltei]